MGTMAEARRPKKDVQSLDQRSEKQPNSESLKEEFMRLANGLDVGV